MLFFMLLRTICIALNVDQRYICRVCQRCQSCFGVEGLIFCGEEIEIFFCVLNASFLHGNFFCALRLCHEPDSQKQLASTNSHSKPGLAYCTLWKEFGWHCTDRIWKDFRGKHTDEFVKNIFVFDLLKWLVVSF